MLLQHPDRLRIERHGPPAAIGLRRAEAGRSAPRALHEGLGHVESTGDRIEPGPREGEDLSASHARGRGGSPQAVEAVLTHGGKK
ncbi:MAG TPA: hypothetical protein VGA30_03965, partial [Actinomycetota bacterium]